MHIETPPAESLTVLVVDDIAAAREQMVNVVRSMGYRCIAAASGYEALQSIDADRPDIVLLDLLMLDMDGFEISRLIREQVTQKWLPVIVMSSLQGDEHFIHALSMGAADYLVKPIRPALLQAKLQHYQNVLALQAKANMLARMKDEFLATVSHELRTPITSVVGAMGLLVSGSVGILPPAALELANIAKRNGDRLNRLIDDVLDLAKLENDRMVFNLEEHRLRDLLLESMEAISGYGERLGVRIQMVACVEAATCEVDSHRFLQVLANLLSNALKHSPKGKVVALSLLDTPAGWCVEVADQGPGMDPAFLPHLFEKFSQAETTERRYTGGTGLGLYISRMLVERMGGRISARSEPGVGSVFSVTLPRGKHHE